jgi:hypothetical protein
MGNPNPFYRFNQSWNAGFYPDNQIMTDLINEMVGQLTIDLPSIWPGKTIDGLYYAIKQWVKVYEEHPYYGRFDFTIQKIPDPPFNSEYNITVFNPDMAALGLPGRAFVVNGFFVPTTKLVVSSVVNAFTPGSFSGSFAEPLINEEIKVSEALEIVNINGSAIFPITYAFNPISNVAISGLARGDNWFIDANGVPDRQPVPNLPYENRRTFELPSLDGDDRYIVSVMERIIQASLNDINSVPTEYAKYTMPDGWTKSIANPSFTTYNRYQINFIDATRRKFILVGRFDGQWLWQRFVSDIYGNSPYNFLSAYSEVTALPYEPLQAGRWIYNNDTFDFEFVDFIPDCYVSPEFYPMPAIPGDQYQFNIVDGNLTGIDSIEIGLFKENGEFIQKIGSAGKGGIQTYTGLGMYGFAGERLTYDDWFDDEYNPVFSVNFQLIDCTGDPIDSIIVSIPPNGLTLGTFAEFKSVVEGLAWPSSISVEVTQDDSGKVIFEFTFSVISQCFCGVTAWTLYEGSGETVYFIKNEPYSQFVNPSQFQGSVTIPAVKDGCYRLGLYNPPTTNCDLTFEFTLSGEALDNYLSSVNGVFGTPEPYISFNIPGQSYVYTVTSAETRDTDIADFCNVNIPGMTVTVGEDTMTFTLVMENLECGETLYSMSNCTSDITGEICSEELWTTASETCECGTSYYLYSLSNNININRADCFSTILEFWSDNNTVAQGYEYFNNWKQRIRIGLNGGGEKPVIEESLYRQSNGVHRRPQNKQDLSIDLHTDFFDLETQLAMTDATRHPYIVWNNQGIFVKGDIDVATIQDFTTQTSFETLSQMKFQALKQGFQPRNSSCLTC